MSTKCRICPFPQELAQYFDTTPSYANAIWSNFLSKNPSKEPKGTLTTEEKATLFKEIKAFREAVPDIASSEVALAVEAYGDKNVYAYNTVFENFELSELDSTIDEIVAAAEGVISALAKKNNVSAVKTIEDFGVKKLASFIHTQYNGIATKLALAIKNAKQEGKDTTALEKRYNLAKKIANKGMFDSLFTMALPTLNKVFDININSRLELDLSSSPIETMSAEMQNIDDEESVYEHWMQVLDHEDPTGSVSKIIKRILLTLPQLKLEIITNSEIEKDANGNVVYARAIGKNSKDGYAIDENGNKIPKEKITIERKFIEKKTSVFGANRLSDPDVESRRLLTLLKDCISEKQMLEILKNTPRYNTDINGRPGTSLYARLSDPANSMMRTTFFTSFNKYFQEYECIDTRIDAVSSAYQAYAKPLNTSNNKNAIGSFFLKMRTSQAPGPSSIFVVEDSKGENKAKNIRVDYPKFIRYRDTIASIFKQRDEKGLSAFDKATQDNKIKYISYIFEGLGMSYDLDSVNKLLFNEIDRKSILDAVDTLTGFEAETLFSPSSSSRLTTVGGEERKTKRIDLKIAGNNNLNKAFTILLAISDPNTIKSKFTSRFSYAGSTMSSYIMPSPYINFIKSIRTLSGEQVDENGNPVKSEIQMFLEDKYLDGPQYASVDKTGKITIYNRWLSDIYNCTNASRTSKSIKDMFAIIRNLGIDNVKFEEISDRDHMFMFLAEYFSHRESYLNSDSIVYVDEIPDMEHRLPGKHYYLNGSPKSYTSNGEEYRKDYAYIPSFITGDTNALRCIRTLHYGEKEIIDGLYNLYLSDMQDGKLRDYMNENTLGIYANAKESQTKNFKFGILDFLNRPEWKKRLNEELGKYSKDFLPKQAFEKIAKEYLAEQFKTFKSQLESLGLFEQVESTRVNEETQGEETVTKYKYFDKWIVGESEEGLNNILWDFYLNYKFGMYNQAQLMQVNPNFFNGIEDFQKRNKGTLTNGLRLSVDAEINGERLFDPNNFSEKVAYFYDMIAPMAQSDREAVEHTMRTAGLSEEEINKRMSVYNSNSLTDGQGIRSFESYRKMMAGLGDQYWGPQQENAYQIIQEIIRPVREGVKDELTVEEIQRIENLKAVFMPIKPIHDGIETFGKNHWKIAFQFKYAEIPIIPEMYPKGSLMRQLGAVMRNKGLDMICSDKASKKGAFGQMELQFATTRVDGTPKYIAGKDFSVTIKGKTYNVKKGDFIPGIDSRGNIITDSSSEEVSMTSQRRFRNKVLKSDSSLGEIFYNYKDYSADNNTAMPTLLEIVENNQMEFNEDLSVKGNYVVHTIPLDNYLIQLNKPNHVNHDVIYGTQIRKIASGYIDLNETYNISGQEFSGQELMEWYNMLNSAKFINSYRDFAEQITDPERRTRTLANLVDSGRVNPAFMQRIALIGKTASVPYNELSNSDDIAPALISMLRKRVIKQTISGGTIVQASSIATGLQYIDDPDLHVIKDEDGNVTKTEIEVPFDFAILNFGQKIQLRYEDYCNADGTFIMNADGTSTKIEEDFPGVLDVILYRIPTENAYSIYTARIKRVTPQGAANTIKLPIEATTISDFDFDIDTLNIMRHSYNIDDVKLSGLEFWETFYNSHQAEFNALQDTRNQVDALPQREKEKLIKGLIKKYSIPRSKLDSEGRPPLHYYWDYISTFNQFGTLIGDKQDVINDYLSSEEFRTAHKEHFDNSQVQKNTHPMALINGNVSEQAIDNMIVDITTAILSKPKAMSAHYTKGGFENASRAAKLTRLIEHDKITFTEDGSHSYDTSFITDEFIDEIEDVDEGFDYSEPMTSIVFKSRNQIAGTLIGIFANDNISQFLSKFMKTLSINETNEAILFGSLLDSQIADGQDLSGHPSIGRSLLFKTMNGVDIEKNVNEFLAASVDAVKNPVLNFLNLNLVTADAAAMLAKLGYTMKDIGILLNQPIIKEACLYMDRHPSEKNIGRVLDKLCSQHFGKDHTALSKSKKSNTNLLTEGSLVYALKHPTEYTEVQFEVAKLFNRIMLYKQDFSDFIQRTRNTSANIVQSTFEDFIYKSEKANRSSFKYLTIQTNDDVQLPIFDIMNKTNDGFFDFNGDPAFVAVKLAEISASPFGYENIVYNLTRRGINQLINEFTLFNTQHYSNCRNTLSSLIAPWGINAETMAELHKFIPLYELRYSQGDFNPDAINPDHSFMNPSMIVDEKTGEPRYKTNAELYLYDTFDALLAAAEEFDLSGNALLEALDSASVNPKNPESRAYIEFNYSYSATKGEMMAISKAWDDLYKLGGSARRFAIMLYMHSYYINGLNPSTNSLMRFAPVSVLNAVKANYNQNESYLDYYRTEHQHSDSASIGVAVEFIKQHLSDPKVAKDMPFTLDKVIDKVGGNTITLQNTESGDYLSEAELSNPVKTKGGRMRVMWPIIKIQGQPYILISNIGSYGLDETVAENGINRIPMTSLQVRYKLLEDESDVKFQEYAKSKNGFIFGYIDNANTISTINTNEIVGESVDDGTSSEEIAKNKIDDTSSKIVDEEGKPVCS